MAKPSKVPSMAHGLLPQPNALPSCPGSCVQNTHLSVQLGGRLLACSHSPSLPLARSLLPTLFHTDGV